MNKRNGNGGSFGMFDMMMGGGEYKDRPGTGHEMWIDDEGGIRSKVSLNADRHNMDEAKDALYYIQQGVTWALVSAICSQLVRQISLASLGVSGGYAIVFGVHLAYLVVVVGALIISRLNGHRKGETAFNGFMAFAGFLISWL